MAATGLGPRLIFTGQHPLDPECFGLGGFPALRLDCPALADPLAYADQIARRLGPIVGGFDMLVVQGDTSSALGAARAAVAVNVRLAHVEAGLRSHDRRRPWPEEDFRVEIDAVADLLFAPTELSAANLRREGVRSAIHVSGNTSIDAVLTAKAAIGPIARRPRTKPALLVTCHRRESWGLDLAGIALALRDIARSGTATVDFLLHPNPETARQMRLLLREVQGIRLLEPFSYRDTVVAMLQADAVLTDSGGMQEECAALGVPALVLRGRTERPEAIAGGGMTLVGLDPDRIVEAVANLRFGKTTAPTSYGDGRASERIASVLAGVTESVPEVTPMITRIAAGW